MDNQFDFTKICKNCIYQYTYLLSTHNLPVNAYLCSAVGPKTDVVTGKTEAVYCIQQRHSKNAADCGPGGQFYKEKPKVDNPRGPGH